MNKWALFLVSPFVLEAEQIAFVTESIWAQGDSFQKAASSETVSGVLVHCRVCLRPHLGGAVCFFHFFLNECSFLGFIGDSFSFAIYWVM